MPPIVDRGQTLHAAVNDTERFVDWMYSNLEVSELLDLPDIEAVARENWSDYGADETYGEYVDGLSVSYLLGLPGVLMTALEEFNNEYIDTMEELYEDEYSPNGKFTLHLAEDENAEPEDSRTEAADWANNPQSLVEIGKTLYHQQGGHYFIYNSAGKLVGEVGEDETGQFVAWVD